MSLISAGTREPLQIATPAAEIISNKHSIQFCAVTTKLVVLPGCLRLSLLPWWRLQRPGSLCTGWVNLFSQLTSNSICWSPKQLSIRPDHTLPWRTLSLFHLLELANQEARPCSAKQYRAISIRAALKVKEPAGGGFAQAARRVQGGHAQPVAGCRDGARAWAPIRLVQPPFGTILVF